VNIALVQLPHFYGDDKSRPPEVYPLGLGYISAFLHQHGIEHDGVDLWAKNVTTEDALESVDFDKYDLLGVTAYATQYKYLREFTLGLKQRWPHITVVCGGPGPTFSAETILRNTGVDVCVIGEGEITMLELVRAGGAPAGIPGLAFLDGDRFVTTETRPYIKDLDSLPFPNRELFDLESYMDSSNDVRATTDMPELKRHARRAIDLVAGRGCPYNCTFCSRTMSGCRLRSIENVTAEVDHLKERWGVTYLQFEDELVITSKKRILALCAALKDRELTWACAGRINTVDREILEAMAAAGCTQISYGVESVTQRILDSVDKHVNADDILPVIQMTREVGIKPLVLYMYGFPGEDDESIAATEAFFKALDIRYFGATLTPLPGSPLYIDLMAQGRLGTEHEYLMRLDSGYNLDGPLLNLTQMSDEEFMAKKARLKFRVDNAYLSKRPLEYARVASRVVARRVKSALARIK
jgi:radical SAM superfamily enzyme YgiQ (UPF0313 family)